MNPTLEEILEIGAAPCAPGTAGSRRKTSKIATTGLVLGLLAALAGFSSLLCPPPRPGYIMPDASAALTAAVLFAILFSVLGLLIAIIACIRIAVSKRRVGGYRLCLATVALAVAANAIWLIYFAVSI